MQMRVRPILLAFHLTSTRSASACVLHQSLSLHAHVSVLA